MSEKECMTQPTKTLPDGWRMVKFGDVVCNVNISEHNPMEKGLERFVGLEHIDPGSLQIKRWGMIEDGITFTRKFVKGQVLFGKRRSYQEKLAVADFDGVCSGDILVFESKDGKLISELLPFIVQNDYFFDFAIGTSSGSLSPRTKWKHLATYEFPLPPIDEQRRIADMLWAAEDCIVKNEMLTDNAQSYKKILVKELLSKGIGHKQFKDTEIGRIPEEWRVVKLEDILEELKNGFPSGKRDENGIVQIRMNNVTTDGRLIFDSYLKVPIPENINFWQLKKDDFLFNNTNSIDLVGKSTIFYDALFPCTFSNHFTRIRFKKDLVMPELILYHVLSLWEKGYFKSVAIRHVGQSAVRSEYLLKLKIPLPPLLEQRQIVEILSKLDDIIRNSRENINKTKALKMMLINQFLKGGLEIAVSINQQAKQLYETQVSE